MSQPLYTRTVPRTYVQLLYEYMESRGRDPELELGEPWPVSTPNELAGINVDDWDRWLRKASQVLNDPLIGLHVGQGISASHLGVLGSVLLACGNVDNALQRLERYLRLVFDVIPMSRRVGLDSFDLVWDLNQYQPGLLVSETGMVAIVQFCRSIVRGKANPIQVDFNHAGPADSKPYSDFFGCPVRFDQPEALLRFPIKLLAQPLKSPDPELVALLEQHADRLLAGLPQAGETVSGLRNAIARSLREGEPDIGQICTQLHLSSRTLQRRLREAETSFRRELNLIRYELALSYLRDPSLQITDIAMLLGYSEHSAFTRAFKKWDGRSPQEAR